MKLSIIVPVFNEEKTIASVLEVLLSIKMPEIVKEVIVIDDGSSDKTLENVKKIIKSSRKEKIVFIKHATNQGKGAAVRTGIKNATGDYVVIQDADLEYNPKDIVKLCQPILARDAQVVYGTRLKRLPHFSKEERRPRFLLHYIGNRFLSLFTSLLYGQWVTDMETCYKVFPRKVDFPLYSRGFEFEPEITAKLMKRKFKIFEVPIRANPRGYEEGKKLNTLTDGRKAIWALLKYRFTD